MNEAGSVKKMDADSGEKSASFHVAALGRLA